MKRETIHQWIRITIGPLFWIIAVQVAWAALLLLWLLALVNPERSSQAILGWGLGVMGMLLLGVNAVVIHFARQATLNRTMKDFISRISHDLKSPLTIVKLHLETMLHRDLTEEQSRICLETARQELGRLESGIEDVLTASRLEHRKMTILARPVDLRQFLLKYLQRKTESIHLQGASLEAENLPELKIQADPDLLERLMDNLVDNAVQHCQKGVRICLSTAKQGNCAVLTVSDDGPGVAPGEAHKIFRMFYRAPQNRGHGRGTGLGLFIVAGIAKAHGGRAWVEPLDRGSAFRVALPLAHEEKPLEGSM